MRIYELTLISEEGAGEAVSKAREILVKHGGKIEAEEDLGIRKFWHRMDKKTSGNYRILKVSLEPDQVAPVEYEFGITQGILRTLFLRPRVIKIRKTRKKG